MAYEDKEAIELYAKPWQQVVMFFARTRKAHQWKSPKYRFTDVRKKCWRAMMREAGF